MCVYYNQDENVIDYVETKKELCLLIESLKFFDEYIDDDYTYRLGVFPLMCRLKLVFSYLERGLNRRSIKDIEQASLNLARDLNAIRNYLNTYTEDRDFEGESAHTILSLTIDQIFSDFYALVKASYSTIEKTSTENT